MARSAVNNTKRASGLRGRYAWLMVLLVFGGAEIARGEDDSPVLRLAKELAAGRTLRANIRHDGSDAYRFTVTPDGAMDVESGTERGVLYAVYDMLAGKTHGDASPAFSIRGLFPCGAEQRCTPEMMRRLIDRMGRWRMNTLGIITAHGYREHGPLIEEECAKRGIETVHYAYYQFAFCDGIPRRCFAVDRQGKPRPPGDRLETEDRLCASNPEARELFRQGVRRYLDAHPDRTRLIFAMPDGLNVCQCKECEKLGPVGQAMTFFRIFMEESEGRRLTREYIVYVQRYQMPTDMSQLLKTDAIMFDTFGRDPLVPLEDPERKTYRNPWYGGTDPRMAKMPMNRYLYERLLDWRAAYPNKLYVFEDLMVHGHLGAPCFNTQVYVDDLKQFKKAGIDGAIYEAYECGIRPFLPIFDVVAQALWDPSAKYDTRCVPSADLKEYFRLVQEFKNRQDWPSCRDLMKYVLAHPKRDQFDWLWLGYDTMRTAQVVHPIPGLMEKLTPEQREFIMKRKLWDYMEEHPHARETVGRLIHEIAARFDELIPGK